MYHGEQSCLNDKKDTLKSQPLFFLVRGIPSMPQGRVVRLEGLCPVSPAPDHCVSQEGKPAPRLPTLRLYCVSLSIFDGLITFSLNRMKLPFLWVRQVEYQQFHIVCPISNKTLDQYLFQVRS